MPGASGPRGPGATDEFSHGAPGWQLPTGAAGLGTGPELAPADDHCCGSTRIFHSTHRPQRALKQYACPARWPATSPAPASSGSSGVIRGGACISAERLTLASEDKACVTGRVGPQVKQERQGGESHSGQRLDESDQGRSGEQRQRG